MWLEYLSSVKYGYAPIANSRSRNLRKNKTIRPNGRKDITRDINEVLKLEKKCLYLR